MKSKLPLAACLLLACAQAAGAPPPAIGTATGLAPMAVLEALNEFRRAQGLPPLAAAEGLQGLAAEHSAAMAARGRLSHDGFAQRFDRSGAELCVENVAQGHRTAEQLIQGWRAVATHHRNMLEPRVTHAGVASHGRYVTFLACDAPAR